MNKKKTAIKLPALYDLPRDKASLDYLFGKVEQELDEDKLQVAKELFEMHRTSTGFDPLTLSKARIKRFRANDLRKFLVEINDIVANVMNKSEYEKIKATVDYHAVFSQFQNIQSKLENGLMKEADAEMNAVKHNLRKSNEVELLLVLNKICQHYYRAKDLAAKLQETLREYNELVQSLERNKDIAL